ncbi:MAG: hypothetical protein U1F54_14600 [Burkholderiales bacterium]
MATDLRTILIAVVVFVAVMVAYFTIVTTIPDLPRPLDTIAFASWWAAPLAAGFICGYRARHRPVVALLVLGVIGAICVGTLNLAIGALGVPTDFGGATALPLVIGLSLLTIIPLVVVGGAVGAKVRDAKHA